MSDHAVHLDAASSSSSGLVNVPKDKLARLLRLVYAPKTPSPSGSQLLEAINCLKLLVGEHVDAFVEGLPPFFRDFALQLLTGNHVYMETLSPNVMQRIKVLKYLQKEYDKLETMFFEEADQLQAKYLKLYKPLYTKRYEIVNGVIDVEGITNEAAVRVEDKAAEENGVPRFWLTAMKTNETLAEEITERDEEALEYLKDIKWCKLDEPCSFKLKFYFDSNPYFQNSLLTKTYCMYKYDDHIFGKSKGTEIEWHPGKCLTHTFLKKPKKRSRNAKGIINTEKCESFFNFFNPPQIPEDDDIDDNAVEELQNLMKHDYEIGSAIQEKIIPHALSYLTEAILKGSSPNVSQRVQVLKYLQNKYDKLETKFFKEKVQLHAKYMNLYEPFYTKRYEIVNGVTDVEGITNEVAVGEENKAAEGVPSFWLTALKNNRTLAEEITERDEEALKYLKDIKWCKLDKPYSFKLEFYFDSNPYFQNSVITKTYDIIEVDDSIVVKSTGTEIEWHPGKCLTHKFLKKPKKRSRNAKGIINTEKCESFFNFFNPPQIPEEDDDINDDDDDDDDDDDVEELQFLMECDYKIGSTIRGLIIPQAVSWFTGEADKWKSKSKSGSMSQPVPTKCSLNWKPPKLNFVKLNTDGACRDRKIAGCGGVIRGNQGEWLGGFAKKIGDCDAFTAELWGVLEGLCLVSRMGFANVEVSTDSQVVVEVLMNGRVQGFANYPLIRKIHNMINRDWNIEFMHEYREANKCADALARIGCSLKHKVTFFRECPDNVKEFLLADELGIVSPRLMAS